MPRRTLTIPAPGNSNVQPLRVHRTPSSIICSVLLALAASDMNKSRGQDHQNTESKQQQEQSSQGVQAPPPILVFMRVHLRLFSAYVGAGCHGLPSSDWAERLAPILQ